MLYLYFEVNTAPAIIVQDPESDGMDSYKDRRIANAISHLLEWLFLLEHVLKSSWLPLLKYETWFWHEFAYG